MKNPGKQGNDSKQRQKISAAGVKGLFALFEAGLKNMYWAEKALTESLPELVKRATAKGLVDALSVHHEITRNHVTRLEKVFDFARITPEARQCEALTGLLHEAERTIGSVKEAGPLLDAAIISAVQKIEHYEIATYGTLCTFASTLDEELALELLEDNLIEEKEADEALSQLAASGIHIEKAIEKTQGEEKA